MKQVFLTIVFILIIQFPVGAIAVGRFSIGPEGGFAYQFHRDFSGSKIEGSPAYNIGLAGVYEFDRDLAGIGIDYSIGYTKTSQLCYRNVQIEGAEGSLREDVSIIYWFVGGRYSWGKRHWRPFAGLDSGFMYFRRGNISYRDVFNAPLPNPPTTNHLNLALIPQFGIEYRPTFRWAIGVAVKTVLAIRSAGIVPGIWVPISLQVVF